jgi:hypothetical protein
MDLEPKARDRKVILNRQFLFSAIITDRFPPHSRQRRCTLW